MADQEEVQLKYKEYALEKPKASLLYFEVDTGNGQVKAKSVWFPKKFIEIDEEDKDVTMPLWLAKEKDIVEFITAW